MIGGVVFDIGETIRDDTREFGSWADWLGVPRHTFSAMIGSLKTSGRDTNEVFGYFRAEFDLPRERALRRDAGTDECFLDQDLYPDVRRALAELRARGLWVAIAGNQSAHAAALLRDLDLPVDAIATSGEWGTSKPAPLFFDCIAQLAPWPRDQLVYVGDHRDNDIVAASGAGFKTALIRRGPWGHLWGSDDIVIQTANWIVNSLDELPELLRPTSGSAYSQTSKGCAGA